MTKGVQFFCVCTGGREEREGKSKGGKKNPQVIHVRRFKVGVLGKQRSACRPQLAGDRYYLLLLLRYRSFLRLECDGVVEVVTAASKLHCTASARVNLLEVTKRAVCDLCQLHQYTTIWVMSC